MSNSVLARLKMRRPVEIRGVQFRVSEPGFDDEFLAIMESEAQGQDAAQMRMLISSLVEYQDDDGAWVQLELEDTKDLPAPVVIQLTEVISKAFPSADQGSREVEFASGLLELIAANPDTSKPLKLELRLFLEQRGVKTNPKEGSQNSALEPGVLNVSNTSSTSSEALPATA
jgi:hypothetical protein